jgi:hypothetical protein
MASLSLLGSHFSPFTNPLPLSPFDALTLACIELVEMLRAGFSPPCPT